MRTAPKMIRPPAQHTTVSLVLCLVSFLFTSVGHDIPVHEAITYHSQESARDSSLAYKEFLNMVSDVAFVDATNAMISGSRFEDNIDKPGDAGDDPTTVWGSMRDRITHNDVLGALSYFSVASRDDYRDVFLSTPAALPAVSGIGTLTPIFINDNTAEYYITDTIDAQVVTFPVHFVRENGLWKVLEF